MEFVPTYGPQALIVLQAEGFEAVKHHLDDHGILINRYYFLFQRFEKEFIQSIIPGMRQLILSSHSNHHGIRAIDVAKSVKHRNPSAIVFAYTSDLLIHKRSDIRPLDGILSKQILRPHHLNFFVSEFMNGVSCQNLMELSARMQGRSI